MGHLPFYSNFAAAWRQAGEDARFLLEFTGMRWEVRTFGDPVEGCEKGFRTFRVSSLPLEFLLQDYLRRSLPWPVRVLARLRVQRALVKDGAVALQEGRRRLAFLHHNIKTGLTVNDPAFKPYGYEGPPLTATIMSGSA